jgi:hypothetical protein
MPMMPVMPMMPMVPMVPVRLGPRRQGGQANKHRGHSQKTFGHVDYPQGCDSIFASRVIVVPPIMNLL